MELKYYIMRRILVLIPTVMGLTLLVFLLFNLVPEYMITAGLVSPHFQGAQRLQAIKIAEIIKKLRWVIKIFLTREREQVIHQILAATYDNVLLVHL